MIHPARFLFNAGSTPKEWNRRMLSDEHLKVLYYEQFSSKVFANTDIKVQLINVNSKIKIFYIYFSLQKGALLPW